MQGFEGALACGYSIVPAIGKTKGTDCGIFLRKWATLFAAITATVPAQTSSVLATGLINPIRLPFTPAGDVLVAENDKTPNSGRISIVNRKGTRRTLIDGLPSGLAAPNLDPATGDIFVSDSVGGLPAVQSWSFSRRWWWECPLEPVEDWLHLCCFVARSL